MHRCSSFLPCPCSRLSSSTTLWPNTRRWTDERVTCCSCSWFGCRWRWRHCRTAAERRTVSSCLELFEKKKRYDFMAGLEQRAHLFQSTRACESVSLRFRGTEANDHLHSNPLFLAQHRRIKTNWQFFRRLNTSFKTLVQRTDVIALRLGQCRLWKVLGNAVRWN